MDSFTFDPEDENFLVEHGLAVVSNERSIRVSPLVREWDGTGETPSDPGSSQDFDEYPRHLTSKPDILVYLGYTPSKARSVCAHVNRTMARFPSWARWLDIAIAQSVESSVPDQGTETSNWWPLFRNLGLSREIHDAIMNREFKDIRSTETAKFWIRDTMEIRYEELLSIQSYSHKRKTNHQALNNAISGGDSSTSSSKPRPSKAHPWKKQGQRTVETSQANNTADDIVPDGHIELWKGLVTSRVFSLDGEIRIGDIISFPPTDFVGHGAEAPVVYLDAEREIAIQYAKFAKARLRNSSIDDRRVSLLRVLVKVDWIEGLGRTYLYGDDWKKVVYLTRRGQRITREPEAEQLGVTAYGQKPILIGCIFKSVDRFVQNMQSWEQITNDFQLRVPPLNRVKATQWAFKGQTVIDGLTDNSIATLDSEFQLSKN